LKTLNSPLRLAAFSAIVGGIGISAAPFFLKMATVNPAILPTSLAISSLIFGSASLYAYLKPRDSLLSWGSSLYAGLLGLIGVNVAGILTHMGKL
jgi:FtsH-binding integral membrane protein